MKTDTTTIVCMGDTMPGGILHYESDDDFCSTRLLNKIKNVENKICVATLETAVGDKPTFDAEKMKRDKDVIYTPIKNLHRLVTLGINVVSLANNHAWDLGLEGIKQAKQELDSLGIKYCGAGANIAEASAPAVVEINGKKIAFIAYCDYKPGTCGYIPIASEDTPGINAMIEENIYNDILKNKKRFDYLFIMMHWGKEYYYYPTPEVVCLSKKIINWGADGIIGSHSHQIQPIIFYKGKPIIFSLGNFLFPDRIITTPRSTFYPENALTISRYPKTYGYPMVKTPTFKIWKDVARNGQVISLELDKQAIKSKKIFTILNEKSHIDISPYRQPLLYTLSKYIVKMPFYSSIFFIMRSCRFLKKKLKGEI